MNNDDDNDNYVICATTDSRAPTVRACVITCYQLALAVNPPPRARRNKDLVRPAVFERAYEQCVV